MCGHFALLQHLWLTAPECVWAFPPHHSHPAPSTLYFTVFEERSTRQHRGSSRAECHPVSADSAQAHQQSNGVWASGVVISHIVTYDTPQIGLGENEQFVEAFGANGSGSALGKGLRVGCADGCVDNLDPLSSKDSIEGLSEFRVLIVDKNVNAWRASFEVTDKLSRLLVDPGCGRMLGTTCKMDTTTAQFKKKEHV